jgi:hypothetical protein
MSMVAASASPTRGTYPPVHDSRSIAALDKRRRPSGASPQPHVSHGAARSGAEAPSFDSLRGVLVGTREVGLQGFASSPVALVTAQSASRRAPANFSNGVSNAAGFT